MKAYGAFGFTLGDDAYRRKLLSGIKRSKSWRRDANAYLRGRARMQNKEELRKLQQEDQ